MISHLSSEKLALKRTMTRSKTTTITSGNTDKGNSTAVGFIPIPQPTTRGQSKRLAPLLRSSSLFQFYVQSTLGSRYLMIERAWAFVRGPPPGTSPASSVRFTAVLPPFCRRFCSLNSHSTEMHQSPRQTKAAGRAEVGGSPIRGRDSAGCSLSRLA